MLDQFTKEYIEAQTMNDVLFTWHGGEPLMRPLSFYRKALELQKKYGRGRNISNVIQTNGTLLTDEWCRFLHENNWLVGVSIDGPQEFHDEYRRTASGGPSWAKVMRGIQLLNKHHVEWNAMAVVNDFNADYPLDFYHSSRKWDADSFRLRQLWSAWSIMLTADTLPPLLTTPQLPLPISLLRRSNGDVSSAPSSMSGCVMM